MNEDYTQQQSEGEQEDAQALSLQATTPPANVPGYRIERFLGAGAFGQVWVGRDLNTGRQVAIKFYLHRGGVNWSLLSREVKSLVQLSAGRHAVQVLEVGWDADPPYYVMEYLSNGSLEDRLKRVGRLPVDESVDLFRKICEGLNHSHGKGVLHCDLKPANIVLDDDDEPRLADFGQSRMSHDQTPALGTLFYMAPEQADLDASPDARWDVYALAAIMYRMLTGVVPYRDERLVNALDTADSLPERLRQYRRAIQNAPTPSAHYLISGVDRPLAQIIDRCLAKRPEDRYDNVQQVLADLSR
ncbi:MAG: serine/threonine-protein kinase, partial [Planctomycetota bacterium]